MATNHDWELSKENVCPIPQGRNVDVLNRALSASKPDTDAEKQRHQNAIAEARAGKGPFANDPLAPWVDFVKWAIQAYPSGSEVIVNAIEVPCRRYNKSARYRDDVRFARLWVRYAGIRQDRLEVFKYMAKHRIGETCAVVYETWAAHLEMTKDFNETARVYQLGLDKHAQPADRLRMRQSEFEKRMAARTRRDEKKKQDKKIRQMAEAHREEARNARPQMRNRSALADSLLTQGSEPDAQGKTNIRPALGSISEHQASTGHRPFSSTNKRPLTVQPSVPKPADKNVPEKIIVFSDNDQPAAQPHLNDDDDDLPQRIIPARSEVQKEDNGRPVKWAGETLPQDQALKKRRGAVIVPPAFKVFEDGEDAGDENKESTQPISVSSAPNVDDMRSRLAQSQSNTNNNSAFAIAEDPMTHDPFSGFHGPSDPPSPTINTKLAQQVVDDAFNHTLTMERFTKAEEKNIEQMPNLSLAKPSQPSANAPIKIFEDDVEKENMGGEFSACVEVGVQPGTSAFEKRVLQSVPELEASVADDGRRNSNRVFVREDVDMENVEETPIARRIDGDGSEEELINFLVDWTSNQPAFQLLRSNDPNDLDEMFDLEPEKGRVITFSPYGVYPGNRQKSSVIVAEELNNEYGLKLPSDNDASDEDEQPSVAVKVSDHKNIWEFYIYRTLEARFSEMRKPGIARVLSYFEGELSSYLVLDTVGLSSMADVIAESGYAGLPEPVAMYFLAELLRTLESVHEAGIVHNDVTLENVLLRSLTGMSGPTVKSDEGRAAGILLVDFNEAIDSQHWRVGGTSPNALARHARHLEKGRPRTEYHIAGSSEWGFNADCYAAAVCGSKMLGINMKDVTSRRHDILHTDLLEEVFSHLCGLNALATAQATTRCMRKCRSLLEAALDKEDSLWGQVAQLVKKKENHLVRQRISRM